MKEHKKIKVIISSHGFINTSYEVEFDTKDIIDYIFNNKSFPKDINHLNLLHLCNEDNGIYTKDIEDIYEYDEKEIKAKMLSGDIKEIYLSGWYMEHGEGQIIFLSYFLKKDFVLIFRSIDDVYDDDNNLKYGVNIREIQCTNKKIKELNNTYYLFGGKVPSGYKNDDLSEITDGYEESDPRRQDDWDIYELEKFDLEKELKTTIYGDIIKRKKGGIKKEFHDKGNIKTEGYLNSYGKPDGVWKRWYENGKLELECNFKNGVRNGKEEEFYKNGKIKNYYTYLNGKIEGIAKSWDEKGKLINESEFKEGKETFTPDKVPFDYKDIDIYKKGDTFKKCKLTAIELSMFDAINGYNSMLEMSGGPFSASGQKIQETINIGIRWFEINNPKVHKILFT